MTTNVRSLLPEAKDGGEVVPEVAAGDAISGQSKSRSQKPKEIEPLDLLKTQLELETDQQVLKCAAACFLLKAIC